MTRHYRTYTKEQLIDAVASSGSIRQVLMKLNLKPYGGNYFTCKKYIKELGLETTHFYGCGWAKGKKLLYMTHDISDYLTNKRYIVAYKLKLRLLKEKILQPICVNCHNTIWLDNPIPLELHHKDGDKTNNYLNNLELLCPNCHALTKNYRGKNKKTIT